MSDNISIVIPFLNEEDNIEELVNYLNENCKQAEFHAEVVFVDDGSTDNSIEVLKKQNFENFDAKIVKLSKNYGSHNAIRAGIQNATNDICTFFSADLQEPFSVITRMYEKIQQGAQVVCAYKENVSIGKIEKLFSNSYSKLIKKYAVKDFPVEGANTLMFNGQAKEILNNNIEKNSSIMLQILDMGFKKEFIPYSLNARKNGKSKWTFSKRIKLFIDSFVNFSYMPIRAVSIIGIIMSVISVLIAIFTIIYKIFVNNQMPMGYPTLLVVVLLGFGITNISLGIVAEYIWRILDSTRNRPAFIVDRVEKIE
ncbi:MAG: glycosyltransferase [Clostridia bacterium]|nr:glycosyltransferase [Clostridia bacterium]